MGRFDGDRETIIWDDGKFQVTELRYTQGLGTLATGDWNLYIKDGPMVASCYSKDVQKKVYKNKPENFAKKMIAKRLQSLDKQIEYHQGILEDLIESRTNLR